MPRSGSQPKSFRERVLDHARAGRAFPVDAMKAAVKTLGLKVPTSSNDLSPELRKQIAARMMNKSR